MMRGMAPCLYPLIQGFPHTHMYVLYVICCIIFKHIHYNYNYMYCVCLSTRPARARLGHLPLRLLQLQPHFGQHVIHVIFTPQNGLHLQTQPIRPHPASQTATASAHSAAKAFNASPSKSAAPWWTFLKTHIFFPSQGAISWARRIERLRHCVLTWAFFENPAQRVCSLRVFRSAAAHRLKVTWLVDGDRWQGSMLPSALVKAHQGTTMAPQ